MADPVLVEADKPLSQSLLWEIQRRYFLRSGVTPWRDDVVPSSISCSPYMAHAYAKVLRGYVRDLVSAETLAPEQPIYVIELGAGSGRLTHNLLHQFLTIYDGSAPGCHPVKFVLTDFVPDTIAAWRKHPKLRVWAENSYLDFAHFDVMDPQPLHLLHADITLTGAQLQNPFVLVANYFFDSVPQDSFVIGDGDIEQNLLSLYSSQPEPNLDDPSLWDRLSLAYEALPLSNDYANPFLNEIRDFYAANLPSATISLPTVGIECLEWWRQLAAGEMLLLSADRGYTLPETLVSQADPLPNLHGSFSMMVNYHAIALYTQLAGGVPHQAEHYQDNLQVGAYLFGEKVDGFDETRLAFMQAVLRGGPDDFFGLRELMVEAVSAETPIPQFLNLLRLSAWDADLLHDIAAAFTDAIRAADPVWYEDIVDMLQAVDAQYLSLGGNDPVIALIRSLEQLIGLNS